MIVEICNLSEWSSAVHFNAYKWSLSRVESSVIIKICDLCERFTAVDAKSKEFDDIANKAVKV